MVKAGALIVGPGTPEERWRAWPALAGLPPATLPSDGRVVVVAAHPDDETLGAGGTLRNLIAAGCSVTVVAVTDGEASHPGSSLAPSALAARRRQELDAALAALGLGAAAVHRLALPDGRLATKVVDIAAALAELLEKATCCIATWRRDGHPDHEAVGEAAARTCRDAGLPLLEYPVWLWHWAEPGDPRVPWERARNVNLDPASRAAKRAAVAAFASQVAPVGAGPFDGPVLTPAMLARHDRPFETLLV